MIISTFISWTVVAIFLIVVVLLFKFLTGKGKPSDQRSGLEKIACSMFSIFRSNVNDVANSIRTPKVLKEEAMQEIDDALKRLKDSYVNGKVQMKTQLKKMQTEILPTLRDVPGKVTAQAENWAKKYKKSVDDGRPNEVFKQTASTFLKQKVQALKNITTVEKSIENLEVAIETAEAEFQSNKIELEMMKNNLLAMPEILRADLDTSLSRISSLTSEITTKLDADRIRHEVETEMRANDSEVSTEVDAEFNNLLNSL